MLYFVMVCCGNSAAEAELKYAVLSQQGVPSVQDTCTTMWWPRSWRGACKHWELPPAQSWASGMTSTLRAMRQHWTPGSPLCGALCAPSDPCHLAHPR